MILLWEIHEAVRLRRLMEQLTITVAGQSEYAMKLYQKFERRLRELESGAAVTQPQGETPLSDADFRAMLSNG